MLNIVQSDRRRETLFLACGLSTLSGARRSEVLFLRTRQGRSVFVGVFKGAFAARMIPKRNQHPDGSAAEASMEIKPAKSLAGATVWKLQSTIIPTFQTSVEHVQEKRGSLSLSAPGQGHGVFIRQDWLIKLGAEARRIKFVLEVSRAQSIFTLACGHS